MQGHPQKYQHRRYPQNERPMQLESKQRAVQEQSPRAQAGLDIKTLEGLMSWFQASIDQLTQEYRRLEERVATLNQELEGKNIALQQSLRER